MENPPSIERETPDEPIKKTFEIKQGKEKYELITELSEDNIVLTILKEDLLFEKFEKNYTLKEIKSLGHIFSNYLSCQDFFIYIKNSIKNKNIIIKEIKDNQISIQFKQNSVSIDLMKKEVNCDLKDPNVFKKFSKLLMNNVKENNNIKKEIIEIKEKNKKLLGDNQNIKKEIKEIKEKNKKLFEENQIRKKENYDVITIYNCIILPYIVIRQPFNLEKKASWFHLIFRHINSNIP